MTEYQVIIYGYPYVMGDEPKHLSEFDMEFNTLEEAKDYVYEIKSAIENTGDEGFLVYADVYEFNLETKELLSDEPIWSTWSKDEQEVATDYIEQREGINQMYQEEEQETYASCEKKHKKEDKKDKEKKEEKKVKAEEDVEDTEEDVRDNEEMRSEVVEQLEFALQDDRYNESVSVPRWATEIALALLKK